MGAIAEWVAGRSAGLTWLEADRYVWNFFAGRPVNWHSDPGALAGATAKAQAMLRSDVQEVLITGPFEPGLASAAGADAVAEALGSEAGRRMLAETVDALDYALGGRTDLALVCPSPPRLLSGAEAADFYAMDDVAAALLEVARSVAGRRLAALVIEASPPGEDEMESWATMIQAAAHYGWASAVRLQGVESAGGLAQQVGADLLLLPDAPPAALGEGRRCGGGLVREFWEPGAAGDLLAAQALALPFRFGEVPAEVEPEALLRRLDQLAGVEGGRI
ncbi:MAG: hypothetical protein M0Z92_10820 [Actinomycetota bacterium]|nr:hypothetical protein [Actinomycetota bacterium]